MDSNLANSINAKQKAKVQKKAPGFVSGGGYTAKEDKQEIKDIRKYYKPSWSSKDVTSADRGHTPRT